MATKKSNILFWNARSISQRKEELPILLRNVDILVCVESWMNDQENKQFKMPGFQTIRQDRTNNNGGGILFLIRNNIHAQEVKNISILNEKIELCAIKITNVTPQLNIIACYRPPGSTLTEEDWDTITNTINDDCDYLLLGDFNSHHQYWNCKYNDLNGKRLLNCIEKKNLFIHNVNSLTRINPNNGEKSNLDLVISHINIIDKICTAIVDDTYGSDHFPIHITVSNEKNLYTKRSNKITSLKTNWKGVSETLLNNFTKFFEDDYCISRPSVKYKIFLDEVTSAIILNTPPKNNNSKSKYKTNPVMWWDSECNQAIKRRKEAFKMWDRSKTLEDHIHYKKEVAITKKLLKRKKRECYRKFAESMNFRTNSTYVWSTLKILKNSWTKPNISNDSDTDYKIKINNALDKISPPWVPTNPDWMPHCCTNDFFDKPFQFDEFNIALETKNYKSTPGLDGIDYQTLNLLPLNYKLILLDIFNEIYLKNDYPMEWKSSFTHFLKKADGNYRPINLASAIGKLFEKLIKNRLQFWAERNYIIPQSQSGFRKGQSCTDNVAYLTLKIEEGFKLKQHVLGTFLDITSAFDNVLWEILLSTLAKIKCSINVINFIKFLCYERHIFTQETGSAYRNVYKGVPQGGVLSPLLFILYIAEVTNNLPKSVIVSKFADDIAILFKKKSLKSCISLTEKSVHKIKVNLEKIGLNLAPHKTVVIHFNNLGITPKSIHIKIDQTIIESSEYVRYLGIILDYKLSFKRHVEYVHNKCLKSLNILKFLRGTWWGADPNTLLVIYKSYIRSLIDYSSFVYFPRNKIDVNKLEKIQYSAIRYALGYRISTPTNILIAESKLVYIKERAKYLCYSYLSKIISNKNLLIHKAVQTSYLSFKKVKRKRLRLLIKCIMQFMPISDVIDSNGNYNIYLTNFSSLITNVEYNIELGKMIQKARDPNKILDDYINKEDAIAIFTDGSKKQNSHSVGVACISENLNVAKHISIN